MLQPINYTPNLPSPNEQLLGSLSVLQGVQQLQSRRAEESRSAEVRQRFQADVAKLDENPTSSDLAGLIARYPSMSEPLKRAHDMLDATQQKARVNQASQVYAAFIAGRPEIAQQLLTKQAAAYKNSGQEKEAEALDTLAKLVRLSPETARTSTGMFLASALGPDKFMNTFSGLETQRRETELQPKRLAKASAEAKQAATESDFTESKAVMELMKTNADIVALQENTAIKRMNVRLAAEKGKLERQRAYTDAVFRNEQLKISRENIRIADAKAKLEREKAGTEAAHRAERLKISTEQHRDKLIVAQRERDSKLREREVKIQLLEQKRDQEVRAQTSDATSAALNIDNMLTTADRILQTPMNVVGSAAGPVSAKLPTIFQSTSDFEALIENFEAQAFLSQIPNLVGMGALSDAEGKKISAALQNFSLKQSPERLMENVSEAQRLLLEMRGDLETKYGIPTGALPKPDVPAFNSQDAASSLVNKYLE